MNTPALSSLPSAADICNALAAAGTRIELVDGHHRLRGTKPPPELAAAVKEHKAAVLAEWERREALNRDRYGRVPEAVLPLRGTLLGQAEGMSAAGMQRITLVMDHIARQGREVCDWINARSNAYFERTTPATPGSPRQCDFTACVDLLCWQTRMQWGNDPVERLQTFEEVAALPAPKGGRQGDAEKRSEA